MRTLFARAHSHHPDAIGEPVAKAARSTQPLVPVGRRLVATQAGVLVPASIGAAQEDDLTRVFVKVARGLYWRRHHRLPEDKRYEVRVLSAPDFAWWAETLAQPVQKLGAEFWWMTGCDPDDLTWSIWLFMIFGAVGVGVWHGAATMIPNLPEPAGVVLREA